MTYVLPVKFDSTSYSNSPPKAALLDPYPTSPAVYSTILPTDLSLTCFAASSPVLPSWHYTTDAGVQYAYASQTNCKDKSSSGYTTKVARYAFYYVWDQSTTIATDTPSDAAFTKRVDIIPSTLTYSKAASRTDCGSGTTCTYDQEIQNFANWYSYYRTRILMTKSSLGLAFSTIDPVQSSAYVPKFRVGFNTINTIKSDGTTSANNQATSDGASFLTIRDFDSTQKQKLYAHLYEINPGSGTPLREQMDRIGRLYSKTLSGFDYTNNDPYRASAADATLLSCRSSYHIMSTDGYWNGEATLTSGKMLADIAKYYYKDLRADITNNVPVKGSTTKTGQLMINFTIGLGASGTIPYSATTTPPDSAWPTSVEKDSQETIDDLWHSAIVSGGSYFSAKNPTDLQSGLSKVLKSISEQTGAASAVAVSSNSVGAGGLLFQPSFDSDIWDGHLLAFTLNADGSKGPAAWGGSDAAALLPIGSRNILTWKPTSGTSGAGAGALFTWASLSTEQQASLGGATSTGASTVLDYLIGDATNEQNSGGTGGMYRYRPAKNKLGDIVNSSPLYVQSADYGYTVLSSANGGGTTYRDFLTAKEARTPTIYVGANDGMLHAFNATNIATTPAKTSKSGVETFAYIPNAVFPILKSLSNPDYSHQYFVDGQLTDGDAYLSSTWKNVLLGSTGAGPAAIFALDITAPDAMNATNVMWEKTPADTGLGDMGKVMGPVSVVLLTTGKWAAIFGNGYDSSSGKAMLYILDLSDGSLITKFDLGGTANGLTAPALVFNSSRQLVGAYAGDLLGKLWKFDLSDASSAKWTSSLLFTTSDGAVTPAVAAPQAIVQKPVIASHPLGGYMVVIGTGKFFESTDKASTQTQSLYGIWDDPSLSTAVTGRAQLVKQTFTAVGTTGRTLTTNPINWLKGCASATNACQHGWYVDLPTSGERVVGDLQLFDNIILLSTTFAPVADICQGGGTSQLIASNYLNGGASPKTAFKVNGVLMTDGKGNNLSSITIDSTATNPGVVNLGAGQRSLTTNDTSGKMHNYGLSTGYGPVRLWHQLMIKP